MRPARRHLLALALPLILAAPLHAQGAPDAVEVHGFGGWTYGRTDRNYFLAGHPEGDFRHVFLALNLSRRIDDKLSIQTQGEIHETHEATEVELDYAFADYRLGDQLSLRIGQVKHPFGIYTEVFDVGTLRPFIALPQAFYGPVGFAGESFKGVGATGTAELGAWTLAYDAYAGGNDLKRFDAAEQFYRGEVPHAEGEEFEQQSNRDVIGGRIVLQTPFRGLSFGGSSYTGSVVPTPQDPATTRHSVVAGQVSYRSNAVTLESEVGHSVRPGQERVTGGYVLGAYRLTPEWQVAMQHDRLTSRFPGADVTAAPSLQFHRGTAVAVSRWVSRSLAVKTEYHYVSGNRLAMPHPDQLPAVIAASALPGTTQLFQFGAQFAF